MGAAPGVAPGVAPCAASCQGPSGRPEPRHRSACAWAPCRSEAVRFEPVMVVKSGAGGLVDGV